MCKYLRHFFPQPIIITPISNPAAIRYCIQCIMHHSVTHDNTICDPSSIESQPQMY